MIVTIASVRHPVALLPLLLIIAATSLACDEGSEETASTGPESASSSPALLPVLQDGRWGYIDTTGAIAVAPRFNRAFRFSEGLALVEADSGFGFIRGDGSFAVSPQFEDAWHFTGESALVQAEGAWHLVNRQGRVLEDRGDVTTDPNFTLRSGALVDEDYQPRPLQLIHTGGRYGYRSSDGDVVIDPTFQNAWYFSDGLARVMIDSLWGYIDQDGEIAIEPRYDLAWDFRNGLALVMIDGKYGYIDRAGEFVWQPSE